MKNVQNDRMSSVCMATNSINSFPHTHGRRYISPVKNGAISIDLICSLEKKTLGYSSTVCKQMHHIIQNRFTY